MPRRFVTRKIGGSDLHSLAFKSCEEGDIPEVSKEEVGQLLQAVNWMIADYNQGRTWIEGAPSNPGVYLVEAEKGFTVVNVNDGKIDTLTDEPVEKITRHLLLKGAK